MWVESKPLDLKSVDLMSLLETAVDKSPLIGDYEPTGGTILNDLIGTTYNPHVIEVYWDEKEGITSCKDVTYFGTDRKGDNTIFDAIANSYATMSDDTIVDEAFEWLIDNGEVENYKNYCKKMGYDCPDEIITHLR